MNQEYIIIRMMYLFNISYDNALNLYFDLEENNLLEHFKLNIDKIKSYEEFNNLYVRNRR